MTGELRFQVLRSPLVTVDGAEVVLAAKPRVLLLGLLLRAGTPVPVSRLAEILWGERLPRHVRASVQTLVSRLRSALGDHGEVVRSSDRGYLVALADDQLDLLRYQRLLASAGASGDEQHEAELLQAALGLWDDDALTGFDSDVLEREEVAGLRESRLTALERRIALDLGLGRHVEIVPELRSLTAKYPMRERLWTYLVLALSRSGRQSDALAAYREVDRLLADQLGIRPGRELQDAHQAVLLGESEAAGGTELPASANWQVCNQLPMAPSHFSGREDEAKELQAVITGADGDIPVAVVSGVPGVGKSALAIRVAHQAAPLFPDGQWYVPLGGAGREPRKPGPVLADLLTAGGIGPHEVPQGLDARAALLRARLARRRVLIVLDDAADPDQVRPLLPGTKSSAVIVTSRRRLSGLTALLGARGRHLNQLTAQESATLLTGLVGPGRLHPAEVDELTELCGHLPLALRITAARLLVETDVSRHLHDLRQGSRLDGLVLDDDPNIAVRAAFGVSFRSLGSSAARLFNLLGLVAGPDFTVDVAAALLATKDATAAEVLQQLAEASLVDEYRPGRYVMHDLLRSYAEEQVAALPSGESARLRLLHHYLDNLVAAVAVIAPRAAFLPVQRPTPPVRRTVGEALAWLDAERANLVAAAADASRYGPYELGWQLADRLMGYFSGRGHAGDWRTAAEAGLRAADAAGHTQALGAMHRSLAMMFSGTGDLRSSRETALLALEEYRRAGDLVGEYRTVNHLGIVEATLSSGSVALGYFQHAAELATRAGDLRYAATTRLNVAAMLRQTGRLDEALPAVREAMRLFEQVGPLPGQYVLHAAAHIHQERGELDEALALQQEEVAALRRHELRQALGESLDRLAAIHRDRGEYEQAREIAQEAVDTAVDVNDQLVECHARATLGDTLQGAGCPQAAITQYDVAGSIAERIGSAEIEVRALLGHATARLSLTDVETALPLAEAAAARAAELDLPVLRGRVLSALAEVRRAAQLTDAAEEAAREAVALLEPSGALLHLAHARRIVESVRAGR
ncbi:transcriptional regulator, SARP family [Kribbella flavida DSM 17836]|uniref:Transcriptional regulator, SARP family n=1 Tax=Kribbella flavida (strain DSM 17836 / JCM 10339 / NBRC 14399) TaxID=479435 RepID=D2PVM6_KRIFD|nr:BTAD domain-containing putative transcriptional regulator [Kribbella flavida]ADB35266.1 transcriptional regulator, SARP family [Kribbella flavida DSM 17836]